MGPAPTLKPKTFTFVAKIVPRVIIPQGINRGHTTVPITRNGASDIHGGARQTNSNSPPIFRGHHPRHHPAISSSLHILISSHRVRHHPFHQLPIISIDPASYTSVIALISDFINLNNINVDAALNTISLTSTVRTFIDHRWLLLSGIIINTFETLEPKAIKALAEGFSIPGGPSQAPPVFCIGPLFDTNNGKSRGNDDGDNEGAECLKWLGSQPSKSVLFLCFGSMGLLSKEQLMEIAVGLEISGQRFLWVVRNPAPSNNKNQGFAEGQEPALDTLLPEGFLNRTRERGLVLKAWAPQVEVLNHDSVGGFVTHCGWNSILESICAGVPMVAWPLYAEQKFNKIILVEEMKLGVAVNKSEKGLVSAEEVEKRVRELMEKEEGKLMRDRAMAMKNEAAAAISEGGSSLAALAQLVKCWAQK
ncbi:hypothetical protein PTKIN_Ptkin12aG0080200 [Pterospermum kingtungense]